MPTDTLDRTLDQALDEHAARERPPIDTSPGAWNETPHPMGERPIPTSTAGGQNIAIRPPYDGDFGDDQFLDAPSLISLAMMLRRTKRLPNVKLDVLWKRKGGKSQGIPTLSKAVLTVSGLAGYYTAADAVIWLAADHIRERAYSPTQIEAILYHELCHLTIDEEGTPALRPHDFAGFLAELEHYGCWDDDLATAKAHFEQAGLW